MRVGIIGGTGLDEVVRRQVDGQAEMAAGPFGRPSAPLIVGDWQGVPIAFLPRHGSGHVHSPSTLPYRANIYALKSVGCTHVIASGAVGSLRETIEPRHLVVVDQVIDKTSKRASTFFDQYLVVHAEFADPFCHSLRQRLLKAAEGLGARVHSQGTYVCMEGPQFSTKSESLLHRQWGGDLIGMTVMPEAKLAREAEMCYALVALATDYDCWRPHRSGEKQELLKEIIANMDAASSSATELIARAVGSFAQSPPAACRCQSAMDLAIWSDLAQVDPAARGRYGVLLEKHLK